MNKVNHIGGGFLIKENQSKDVFTREEFTEDQWMMFEATKEFNKKEVLPNLEKFEKPDYLLVEKLMKEAGNLGLLAISSSEEHGGLGMGFNTSMLICEEISSLCGSLATAYGAHTGIGTLPIELYGSQEIKNYFLPKITSGEWISCYNLTEPNAGSDANSGKTKAILTADGEHYEISGQKIWISNAGFADVFIVFARIEEDKNITGFVFEKNKVKGLSLNEEEKKLGIRSSSTRQVFYDKVKVPKKNMLGERNGGFKIAVNALNAGRIKLSTAVNGAAIKVINLAIKYANERKQFNEPISTFGAIKQKLANIATRIYATDSGNYRTGNDIEEKTNELVKDGVSNQIAKLKGMEEFAIECAILKVYGSETIQLATDEGVQIYGGMGFSADTPMEACYRDARISRIYEGTNEINRILTTTMLLKKAIKGDLDLLTPAKKIAAELLSIPSFKTGDNNVVFYEEKIVLENLKKSILMIAGKATEKYGKNIISEQEVLMDIAEMIIEVFMAESTILRTEKLIRNKGQKSCERQIDLMILKLHESISICKKHGREAIYAISNGDEQRIMLMGLKRFTKINSCNLKELRRRVADEMIEKGEFCYFRI